MKKMFVKVLSLLLVTAAFAVLVGCKNNADDGGNSGPAIDQALVGTWNKTGGALAGAPTNLVLKSDGTGTADGQPFTWTATNGSLKITANGSVLFNDTYTISGNTFTFGTSSNSATYQKL